jgi:steroid 5-alpha reductase family enzyme
MNIFFEPEKILITTLLISLLIQTIFFIIAAILKTDKFTDLTYSLTFILLAVFSYLISGSYQDYNEILSSAYNISHYADLIYVINQSYKTILLLMIIIWAVRLAVYLIRRILITKKDKRFDGVRENFLKFAQFWFFQAISVWIILLPSIIILTSDNNIELTSMSLLGIFYWLIGIIFETIADIQKFHFKLNPKNKDKWISTGLWKYSRHPNYFGEILCWFGIFIYIFPNLKGIQIFSIVSPIYITILLLFVSGIPILEKSYNERFKNNKEYQKYKKQTSILIPLLK